MQTAINETRVRVWRTQPAEFFAEAVIDADGTLAETTGQCKEGMDIAYNGVWGYHPLVVSLSNTGEPLFLVNRSGNRPLAEGAAERFDQAHALCRDAGFQRLTFRGDTDFTQTRHLDRWDNAARGRDLCECSENFAVSFDRAENHAAGRPISLPSPRPITSRL